MRIIAPIQVCVSNKCSFLSPKPVFGVTNFGLKRLDDFVKKKEEEKFTAYLFLPKKILAGELAQFSKGKSMFFLA